ncbi:N-terminal methionine N(alpha)-acetyltransferase NatE [Malassezia psittaci]|uniref:Pre-mRNA-splicing factor CWC24 n=1 Tax=Malassezia psittaci TaxID=1821823 RepID=A0AAF0F8Y8_9BASI|nr:N-terminal methionine N(alpha)-acetyltransferase NatE [Malassezia psittaci]
MTDVVFRKRGKGVRDVRKNESVASLEPEEADSVVVTKKIRVSSPEPSRSSTRVPDRYGQTTVHAATQAHRGTSNANQNRNDATRGTEWDLEAEFAKELGSSSVKSATKTTTNDDGKYRGMANYAKYTEERDDGSSAKFRTKGPMQAPTNVRTITVVDYQPDVCKDYKETGYCGFGDTCKFLHDRSDYLAGWQLQAPGETADARAGTYGAGLDQDEEEEQEDIPFACLICRKPFTDPIVTLCGHYFCSPCAIRRFAKTPKCFACGAKTHGLFHSATKILDRMAKRNARRAEERQEQRVRHGLDNEPIDGDQVLDGVVIEAQP